MERPGTPHLNRTYAVTGAASGIGAATAGYLREGGATVIGCDLHDAEVIADLATPEGRGMLAADVARLSRGRLDGVVANAGGGPPETLLSLNHFGAVATLEGLRPLLAASPAPRAVVVSSIGSLAPTDAGLIEACLGADEAEALAAGNRALLTGTDPLALYGSAKHALTRWCRAAALQPEWAGRGIALNVVAAGVVDTPAAAFIVSDPERRAQMGRLAPLRGAYPARPQQMAATLAWCVSPENALMTGQVLFADAGFECLVRGVATW